MPADNTARAGDETQSRVLEAEQPPPRPPIRRGVAYNLFGLGTPLLAALVTVPLLVARLGVTRFGVLTLAWALIGHASIFDLGLGRALTQAVAVQGLGDARGSRVASLVWTGLAMLTGMGSLAAIFVALGARELVVHALHVPPELLHETVVGFRLLALSLPFVIASSGLRGTLEARQYFGISNAVRTALGVGSFLLPLLGTFWSRSLVMTIGTMVALRAVCAVALLLATLHVMPGLKDGGKFARSHVSSLLRTGGWMTVTNVVSPFMASLDRFLIGSFVSSSSVAYYTTPFEMCSKLTIVPGAIASVLFPSFSENFTGDRARTRLLYSRSLSAVFLLTFPFALGGLLFAKDALHIWLGPEFAARSFRVAQILTVGFLVNGIAAIPFALVQAAGRSDTTAKFHLIELPLYLVALVLGLKFWGISGAALAMLGRVTFDAVLLLLASRRLLDERSAPYAVGVIALAGLGAIAAPIAALPALFRVTIAIAITACVAVASRDSLRLALGRR